MHFISFVVLRIHILAEPEGHSPDPIFADTSLKMFAWKAPVTMVWCFPYLLSAQTGNTSASSSWLSRGREGMHKTEAGSTYLGSAGACIIFTHRSSSMPRQWAACISSSLPITCSRRIETSTWVLASFGRHSGFKSLRSEESEDHGSVQGCAISCTKSNLA
jgi:hypothetical protein